jgi:hypothetical protein
MFTHNNMFWVAALLLATMKLPDYATPLNSISRSLEEFMAREPAPLQPSPAPMQSPDVKSGIQPEPEGPTEPEASEEASQAEGENLKPGSG